MRLWSQSRLFWPDSASQPLLSQTSSNLGLVWVGQESDSLLASLQTWPCG